MSSLRIVLGNGTSIYGSAYDGFYDHISLKLLKLQVDSEPSEASADPFQLHWTTSQGIQMCQIQHFTLCYAF